MKKKYILCAAIWFVNGDKDFPYQPKNIDRGIVLCGHRHACIFQQWAFFNTDILKLNVAGRHSIGWREKEQGFLTSENRFVNREEAYQIAHFARQIDLGYWSTEEERKGKQLYSEDLY